MSAVKVKSGAGRDWHFGRRLSLAELVALRQKGLQGVSPEVRALVEVRRQYVESLGIKPAGQRVELVSDVVGAIKPEPPVTSPAQPAETRDETPAGPITLGTKDSGPGEAGKSRGAGSCALCGRPLTVPETGRRPKYCSDRCRKASHRRAGRRGTRVRVKGAARVR